MRLAGFLLAGVFLAGCARVDVGVQTRVVPAEPMVLANVLLVVDCRRADNLSERVWLAGADFAGARRDSSRFTSWFVPAVRAGLDSLGVATECIYVSATDKSLAVVADRAGDFPYEAVLSVSEHRIEVTTTSDREGLMVDEDVYGVTLAVTLLVEPLPKAMTGEPAWSVLLGGRRVTGVGVEAMADQLAVALVAQFGEDVLGR